MHLNKGGGRATVLGGAIAVLSLGCGGTDGDLKGGGTGDAATTTDTTMAVTTTDTTTGPEEGTTYATTMATTEGDETQTGADFLIRPDAGTTELGQCLGVSDAGYIAMLLDLDPNAEPPVCSPTPSPCETDVVGTWTMRDFCLSEDTFSNNQGCPGSEVTIVDRDLQGTYTFADDATFSAQLVSTITTQIVLNTVACFGITCVEHEQSLNESPNLVAVCTEQGQDCSCLMTSTQMIAFEGTHAVTEAGVVLTVDGRAGEPIEACRTGDRLALWQPRSAIELFFDSLCETPADCEEKFGELYEQWHCV